MTNDPYTKTSEFSCEKKVFVDKVYDRLHISTGKSYSSKIDRNKLQTTMTKLMLYESMNDLIMDFTRLHFFFSERRRTTSIRTEKLPLAPTLLIDGVKRT